LFAGVHEGVLKSQERMIVGSVAVEVYQRIETYVRKAAGDEASPTMSNEVEKVHALEQNKNLSVGSAPVAAGAPQTASAGTPSSGIGTAPPATSLTPAQSLRVGTRVLAAYWNKKKRIRRLLARRREADRQSRIHTRVDPTSIQSVD
jgi:hypothetical protein